MAQVDISINGQTYRISCEDGQEQRLRDLSSMVDAHVKDLVEQIGQVGHTRLLVMASLLVADELVDLRETVKKVDGETNDESDTRAIKAIERIAGRLEAIASRVNQA
ncbi:MAG: cell division protein ZapA [Rhodospirillaceae bacterium]|nr:cell division protein ZapA [Rhodospirillaceae bacterium]